MGQLEPDRGQLADFVNIIFRQCGKRGVISLRAFYEDRSIAKPRLNHTVSLVAGLNPIIDAAFYDARVSALDAKPVVFCPPLAVFDGENGLAREEDILEAPTLSVEMDKHPRSGLFKLETALSVKATLVVGSGGSWTDPATGETEPKLHAHWRLKTPARGKVELAKLKQLRGAATALAGGDPSNIPACHPIRWAGSVWRKPGASPRLCSILDNANADAEIDLDQALDAIGKVVAHSDNAINLDQATEALERAVDASAPLDWTKAFADILSGESYHPTLTPLSTSMARVNLPERTTRRLLSALMANSRPSDPERANRREVELARLPQTISSAYRLVAQDVAKQARGLFDPWEKFIVPVVPWRILPPELYGFVAAQSKAIGGDPSALAMAVLTGISGAIDHRTAVKMQRGGGWLEHPNLWTLLVGDPSTKKTPLINVAIRPLDEKNAEVWKAYMEETRVYEERKEAKDKSAKAPERPPRYVAYDVTVEALGRELARRDRGILVKRDELPAWIADMDRYRAGSGAGRKGGSDRGVWLKAYDGGNYSVDRVTRDDTVLIPNLSVSLIGGVQPDRLVELTGLASDGLLQRFIPVMMRSAALPIDVATETGSQYYGELITKLVAFPHRTFNLTDRAIVEMEALRAHLFQLEQVTDASFQTFIGKLPGLAGRLAIVLHLAEKPEDPFFEIDHETAGKATLLIREFIIPHAREFYLAGAIGEDARKIAAYILTSGKTRIVASDLTINVRSLRGKSLQEVQRAVSPLVAGGWLEPSGRLFDCYVWNVRNGVKSQFEARRRTEEARASTLAKLMNSPRRNDLRDNSKAPDEPDGK